MIKQFRFILIFILAFPLFAENYSRIVCLSPSGAEILCAVGAGDKIVARTDYCDYPATLEKIESIGGFDGKTLSVEKIVATQCDFVYGSRGMHDFLKEPLEKFGIVLHLESANSLAAILDEILYCGKVTGNEAQAEQVAGDISAKIAVIKAQAAKKRPAVYWEIWNQPLMSVGKSSYINELIEIAGGRNIFAEIEGDYPIVSAEAILKAKPDFIILPSDSTETLESLKRRPAWKKLRAIKSGNVKKVDSSLFNRPGPRVAEAAEVLRSILDGAE